MIEQEFQINDIVSVEFGVSVGDGDNYIVPTDKHIQDSLKDMLGSTVGIILSKDDKWSELDVSEDYSRNSKIYCPRNSEFMEAISDIYDVADIPDRVFNISEIAHDIFYYFAIFRDSKNAKLVAMKKATQFKGILRNRLISIHDNTLKLVDEEVFRLDYSFDILVCLTNIYTYDVRSLEYLAYLGDKIATAAEARLARIQEAVPFLDLSGIASSIGAHHRTARLATAVARRVDLASFDRAKIQEMATSQGIALQVTRENRLKPKAADRHRLLEILDDRRYVTDLTAAGPVPFVAKSRQRVKRK